nr:alpha/beta fold hydrolase [Clostridia bacterium]
MHKLEKVNSKPDFSSPNCQPFLLEGGSNAVLLIHGFTGSPGHMRPLGDALHRAGYTVQGMLLPGHGTTLSEMVQCNWRKWLDAATDALRALRERYRTVTLGGLSMGGLISLRVAELNPVDALLL